MSVSSSTTSRQEKVREAHGVVDQHFQELLEQMQQGKSEALLRYLEFTARFHQYSFGNILLILVQKPEATHVAGLRNWNRLGRHVKQGEKGIMILAPMTVTKRRQSEAAATSEEAEEATITLFKVVYVFDVSQTDGAPLPTLLHAAGDAEALYPALQNVVCDAGIRLDLVEFIPGAPGAFGASFGGRIAVRQDLDAAEGFRTLAHELAHEQLHWIAEKDSKVAREVEADATAFVVCRHFGIEVDTADYLLLYDATPEVLLQRLDTVRTTAAEIITRLQETLARAAGELVQTPEAHHEPQV